jgi:nucleotide-binding universal stress UspA family protein
VSLIERILCPVDPDWPAYSALKYSFALAERFRASIDVVHARSARRSRRPESSATPAHGAAGDQRLRERLEKTLNDVRSAISGSATARIIEGQPLTALLTHSRRTRCDLVVVGSGRLRSDVLAFRTGIGEAVAHHADCAVLSLCETEALSSPLAIRRLLLAVDFSDTTELSLDWTAALARRFGACLQLLHVRNPATSSAPRFGLAGLGANAAASGERLNEIEYRLARRGIRVEQSVLADGDVADRVLEHAASADCDLIVLGAHGRFGGVEGAIGGVVADVRRRARVPVLSVRRSCSEVLFASPAFGDPSAYARVWAAPRLAG